MSAITPTAFEEVAQSYARLIKNGKKTLLQMYRPRFREFMIVSLN